ncbi:MAG: CRISPR-associated endonuclease Cas1 [Planctomycetota bacterium]|nr:CRISPR-associated endonuclease Cas1 [Planctomycetota bacterium]
MTEKEHVAEWALTPFYRFRFVVRVSREVRLPTHHAAVVYALLANANSEPHAGSQAAIPDGWLLDAPEQGRVRLRAGETFAFGGTLIAENPGAARHRLDHLREGLQRVGQTAQDGRDRLGGNFSVELIEDLVAGRVLAPDVMPVAVPVDCLTQQLVQLSHCETWTLRFTSPVRIPLDPAHRTPGHGFFDRQYFDARSLVARLRIRLPALGVRRDDGHEEDPHDFPDDAVHVVGNELVWLDIAYGRRNDRNSLGGCLGRLRLRVSHASVAAALVWGQFARAGKNLAWGFGAYHIEELGTPVFTCRRSRGLLEDCLTNDAVDHIARRHKISSGELRQEANRLRRAEYQPPPPHTVEIPAKDGTRTLHIPPRLDRALQRLVLDAIAPALDQFFESSSFAWRKGFSRQAAARTLADLYEAGCRYAVQNDFDRFFDTVPLAELQRRLEAYLGDGPTVHAIMLWMRAGGSDAEHGIPTGSPLSPLLGNLLLDQFDEQIAAEGGRLVRYADDFLVLCKTEAEAQRLYGVCRHAADELLLHLNSPAGAALDLDQPFGFVGFRFERHETWQASGPSGPQPIAELYWHDASANKPTQRATARLAGEPEQPPGIRSVTGIVGPDLAGIEIERGILRARYVGQDEAKTIDLDDLSRLVLLGNTTINTRLIAELDEAEVSLLLADRQGRMLAGMIGDEADQAQLLMAQVDFTRDPVRCLAASRAVVAAKLANHAAVARAIPVRGDSKLADELQAAAARAEGAANLDMLRGIEGSAAARWYREFGRRLGRGFTFQRRVAPRAEDAVNVLLNIAHTAAYRSVQLAIRAAGLSTAMGFFHSPTPRYASLASDLQEPFRHLMERAVIQATFELAPSSFRTATTGPFPLRLSFECTRRFQAIVQRQLETAVVADGGNEPYTYRDQIVRQVRSLRRHILDEQQPFVPFRHPPSNVHTMLG